MAWCRKGWGVMGNDVGNSRRYARTLLHLRLPARTWHASTTCRDRPRERRRGESMGVKAKYFPSSELSRPSFPPLRARVFSSNHRFLPRGSWSSSCWASFLHSLTIAKRSSSRKASVRFSLETKMLNSTSPGSRHISKNWPTTSLWK